MRSIIKGNQLFIINLFEQVIFPRIAISLGYDISLVPKFYFLEDNDTALSNIETIQKKSTALTSLANTYALLFNSYTKSVSSTDTTGIKEVKEEDMKETEEPDLIKKDTGNGTVSNKVKELAKKVETEDSTKTEETGDSRVAKLGEILTEMEDLLLSTIKDFKVNNDVNPLTIEPYKRESSKETKRSVENSAFVPNPKFSNAFGIFKALVHISLIKKIKIQ